MRSLSAPVGLVTKLPVTWFRLTFLDEIALYDRQIRLWGVHAQEK